MIVTVSFVGLLELFGEVFLIPSLSSSILVPIIITPWYIDRYVVETERNGYYEAVFRLSTTLFVSVLAFIFMSYDPLVTFVVVNPETWLVLVGVVLYFGRSARYTLIDKQRFNRFFNKRTDPMSIQIRNRNYIAKYNSQILFNLVNKFDMKEQFAKWNVPTPELLGVIDSEQQVGELMKRFAEEPEFENGFVIKPSASFGGKGIQVIRARDNDGNFVIGSNTYAPQALEKEIRKILQGEYLTSQTMNDRDIVLIEERVVNHPDLEKISTGLPDVRVIVFRGIPVLAMMRLSTKASQGLANLKQGAIGAAVRLSDGLVYRAEIKKHEIERHPDTGEQIVGFQLENWPQILATAALAQKSSGLGYAGVDIVIDERNRILLLEVNKRPGLEIQNITQSSLLERFEMIEEQDLDASDLSPIAAARMGMELATNYWEKEVSTNE